MGPLITVFAILFLFVGCGDTTESNNGTSNNGTSNNGTSNNGSNNNGNSADICFVQTEVTQEILADEERSSIIVDVPAGWGLSDFTTMPGHIASPPTEDDFNRPQVAVGPSKAILGRAGVEGNLELVPKTEVGKITFHGEEVSIYLAATQPAQGFNLEIYPPIAPGSDELVYTTVNTRFLGSTDDQDTCQDTLLPLAILVAESIRPNPGYVLLPSE